MKLNIKPIEKERLNNMAKVLKEIHAISIKEEDIIRIANTRDNAEYPIKTAGVIVYVGVSRGEACCVKGALEVCIGWMEYSNLMDEGCPDKMLQDKMLSKEDDFIDYWIDNMFDEVVVRFDKDGNPYVNWDSLARANRVIHGGLRHILRGKA